jgi:CHASE3 domain sensor protein
MRPAIEVWREALDAAGPFIRFRDKPEQKAAAVIEADRAEARAELVAEIVAELREIVKNAGNQSLMEKTMAATCIWVARRIEAKFGGRDG